MQHRYLKNTQVTVDVSRLFDMHSWHDREYQKACSLALRISRFEIGIAYRPGMKRQAADGLFRLHTTKEDDTSHEENVPLLAIDGREKQCKILDISDRRNKVVLLNAQEKQTHHTQQ